MIRADAIYLVAEDPEEHGIFEERQETPRLVPADIRSVSGAEVYRAKQYGLNPEYVFILSDYAEYDGEKIVVWNDVRWAVIRTYVDHEKIELTVERAAVDAEIITEVIS